MFLKGERLCLLPLLELSQHIILSGRASDRTACFGPLFACVAFWRAMHCIPSIIPLVCALSTVTFIHRTRTYLGNAIPDETGTMNQGESEISTRTNPWAALVNCCWLVPQALCPYAWYADTQSFIIDSCPRIILEIIIESFART